MVIQMQGVTWPIPPHTKAKHDILRRYLQAWFPIIASTRHQRLIYLDGFAGPGEYKEGEEGSPVIALQALIEHKLWGRLRENEFIFFFIEKDKKRAIYLENLLKGKFPACPSNIKYYVIGSEFEPTLSNILDDLEEKGSKLAPTFAFIDPFGFSGFSMELIGRFLQHEKCEVLVTFMSGFAKRFLDELRENALNNLFASEEWKGAIDLRGRYRESFLLNLFVEQLKKIGEVKYVRTFEMNEGERHIYDLVFATKGLRGLEVMKEAMWKQDQRGFYMFSDTTAGQTFLTDFSSHVPVIANLIYEKFMGKTIFYKEIHEFIIAETDYIFRTEPLKFLEKQNKIVNVTNRKRRFSYPKGCKITFA